MGRKRVKRKRLPYEVHEADEQHVVVKKDGKWYPLLLPDNKRETQQWGMHYEIVPARAPENRKLIASKTLLGALKFCWKRSDEPEAKSLKGFLRGAKYTLTELQKEQLLQERNERLTLYEGTYM